MNWVLFAFASPPVIQQRVHMGPTAHLQSLRNPAHRHQCLPTQPLRLRHLAAVWESSMDATLRPACSQSDEKKFTRRLSGETFNTGCRRHGTLIWNRWIFAVTKVP